MDTDHPRVPCSGLHKASVPLHIWLGSNAVGKTGVCGVVRYPGPGAQGTGRNVRGEDVGLRWDENSGLCSFLTQTSWDRGAERLL